MQPVTAVLLRSLSRALLARLREKMSGQSAPDGIDLLVTGCEAPGIGTRDSWMVV